MRRTVLISTALLLLAMTPRPALAAEDDGVTWEPLFNADGTEVPDDDAQGRVELRGTITASKRFSTWRAEIVPVAGQHRLGPVCEGSVEEEPESSAEIHCTVDTMTDVSGRPSGNGRYAVRVRVGDGEHERRVGEDRVVTVTNVPATPAGVRILSEKGSGRVHLEWRPNEEPDLLHYLVEQRVGEQPWTEAGRPASPAYDGAISESGIYRFRIAAVRPGKGTDRTVTSRWNPTKAREMTAPEAASPAGSTGEPATTTTTTQPAPDDAPARDATPAKRPTPEPTSAEQAAPRVGAGPTGFDDLIRSGDGPMLVAARPPAAAPRTPSPPRPAPAPARTPDSGYSMTLPYPASSSAPPAPAGPVAETAEADVTQAIDAPAMTSRQAAAPATQGVEAWPLRRLGGLLLVVFALCLMVFTVRRVSRVSATRPAADTLAERLESLALRLGGDDAGRSLDRLEEILDLQLELVCLARDTCDHNKRDGREATG